MTPDQFKRQHRRYERQLAAVIAGRFTGQAKRVATELRDFNVITTATIDQVFRVDDEHARFMAAIRIPLSTTMLESAYREWKSLQPHQPGSSKAWGAELVSGLWKRLPFSFRQLVRAALDELEAQEYWQAIQQATKRRLTSIVRAGLTNGDTTPMIAKRLRASLGGSEAKARALAIARTETTGAMNAGHHATHKGLSDDGAITGRVWRSILDDDVRETHRNLDNVSVKGDEMFDVGGAKAPYPGWYGLPAKERVNCRCVVTAKVD